MIHFYTNNAHRFSLKVEDFKMLKVRSVVWWVWCLFSFKCDLFIFFSWQTWFHSKSESGCESKLICLKVMLSELGLSLLVCRFPLTV